MHRKELAKPQYPIWVNIIERRLFPSVAALIRPAAPPASPGRAMHPAAEDERPPERPAPPKMILKEERINPWTINGDFVPLWPW